MEPLNSILLIDDDNLTNYLHKILLQRTKIIKNIHIANNGLEAIEMLFDCNMRN